MMFNTASEVRKFLKPHGFTKIKVRYGDNPFGGAGRFFVTITDLSPGTLIHSSGSQEETTTFGDNAEAVNRIATLRDLLKGSNASVSH